MSNQTPSWCRPRDVEEYAAKAVAMAQARAPQRRKLVNLMKKARGGGAAFDQVGFEEAVVQQLAAEVFTLLTTARHGLMGGGASGAEE